MPCRFFIAKKSKNELAVEMPTTPLIENIIFTRSYGADFDQNYLHTGAIGKSLKILKLQQNGFKIYRSLG